MPADAPSPLPVEVWFARIHEPHDASVLDAARGRLEVWEEERLGRFRRTEDQVRFAAAHILVRVLLSSLSPVHPTGWRLAQAPDGKPFVSSPPTDPAVHFSLSHTAGLVACAGVVGAPVGVDVEALDRRLRVEGLARHTLTHAEIATRPENAVRPSARWFLRYWTLKEALVKAVGVGLRVSLESVEVSPGAGGPAGILGLPPAFGDPSGWQAHTLEPLDTHVAAVAARAATALDVRWKLLEVEEVLKAFA
jgi:4'-phosphopantetheinyl transferase